MIAALALLGVAAAAPDAGACAAAAAEDPASITCWYDVARATGDYPTAIARVTARRDAAPEDPWAAFVLANLVSDGGDVAGAIALYRAAIAGFDAGPAGPGSVLARLNLVTYLAQSGDDADVDRLLAEARERAGTLGRADLQRRARAQWARTRYWASRELAEAEAELRALAAEPMGPDEYQTRLTVLHTLAILCGDSGRDAEAGHFHAEVAAMAAERGDAYVLATARVHQLHGALGAPDTPRDRIAELGRQALEAAVAGGNPFAALEGRCAQVWALEDAEARRAAWPACLDEAERDGDPEQAWRWPALAADRERASDPALAAGFVDRALGVAERWAIEDAAVWGLGARSELRVAEGRPEEALAPLDALLARIDATGASSDPDRPGGDPGLLAEVVYRPAAALAPTHPDRALAAIEALRGAHLARQLRAAGAFRALADRDDRRAGLRSAVDAGLDALWELEGEARAAQLGEIRRLRAEMEALDREDLASLDALPPVAPPTFAELSGLLRADEALVAFQLPIRTTGGAPTPAGWAWIATPGGLERVELPIPRDVAETRAEALASALRAGFAEQPAAALFRDLVAPAWAALGPEVRHVWLVPDGPLYTLPVGALPTEPDGPLADAARRISLLPSVSHLQRVRGRPARAPRAVAVGAPLAGEPLGAAPRELAAVAAAFPGGSARAGAAATEPALVAALTDPGVGLVHVAAHAEVDAVFPERTRILLTPGDGADGALTAGEIARLPVPGTVVVLSACDTVSGRTRWGDGPAGLARAFLQAGAGAVVATTWPVRDADAAAFFELVYAGLGDGMELGEAVAAARIARRDAGAPPEAWAGVVVLGDGRWTPFPGGRPRPLPVPALVAFALGWILVFLGIWSIRRSRQKLGPKAR